MSLTKEHVMTAYAKLVDAYIGKNDILNKAEDIKVLIEIQSILRIYLPSTLGIIEKKEEEIIVHE